jgi:hypothetical protein
MLIDLSMNDEFLSTKCIYFDYIRALYTTFSNIDVTGNFQGECDVHVSWEKDIIPMIICRRKIIVIGKNLFVKC